MLAFRVRKKVKKLPWKYFQLKRFVADKTKRQLQTHNLKTDKNQFDSFPENIWSWLVFNGKMFAEHSVSVV